MLHLKKVLGAKPKEHVQVQLAELFTPWGQSLDPDHVWEEHPTPQFARTAYATLNGMWDCAFVESSHNPTDDMLSVVKGAKRPHDDDFDSRILVPFSPETPLSKVDRQLQPNELLWYRRFFAAPGLTDGQRLILHFQAVDYACAVYMNGILVGAHAGGYEPFAFDVTDALAGPQSELCVCVADPSEEGGHLRGKQRFDRGDIWYTAQSGIWQSVWYEIVPAARVTSLVLEPDLETNTLIAGVKLEFGGSADALPLRVEVLDDEDVVVASACAAPAEATCVLTMRIDDTRPWSPEDPYLYGIRLTFGDDEVLSYCGFRSVQMQIDEAGHKRVFLNGKPLFIKGVLDQAYWSDGFMTAPSDEALIYDIQAMKQAGFNLMRKHIKVEAERWYYHCDRLGMLVLQDMVNGGDGQIKTWQWSYKPTLFKISWNHYRDDVQPHREQLGSGDASYRQEWSDACCATVRLLGNHPSIIGWSLFNEGWGQFNAKQMCSIVRNLDPTRLIDATSGWYDQRCGDFSSVHNYFRDMKVWHDRRKRAFFVSEFGGFTHRVDGHSALDEAYGYEPYDELDDWRNAVRELLDLMDSLESKGLAGYVFTQVSDIEEETNGILTYDRRVNKFPGGLLASAPPVEAPSRARAG